MATELGQAYVQIMPSAKGISGEISKLIDPEAKSAGASAGKKTGGGIVSTLKKVIVAAGIGKLISSAITEGGELEQNLGGTEAVFGDFAKNIQASASDAYKNMGLSASDYMATANKMGSLFQGSGMDQQKSLDLTSDAMQRAADVASVMGIDTSAAMESIAGAAKGNFTMMDNLGVAMNATSLQAYALEKGINFDWNTASEAEKSELAMQMFMERTSQYAGNFARESEETFTGSLGAMKSSWQNVLGSLATGQDIEPALTALSTSLVTFVQNLMPMVTSILTQLPTILVTLLTEAGPQLMATGAQAVASILSGIAQTLPTLIPVAIEAILTIVNTLIENMPLIVDGALQLITGLAEGLLAAIPVIVEKIPEIIDSIIGAIVELLPLIIEAGIALFTALIESLPTIISTIVSVLPEIVSSIIDAALELIPLIIQAGIDLFVALVSALPEIIETIVAVLPQIIDSIVDAVIGSLPQIIDAGLELFVALIGALPEIIVAVVGAIPDIIAGIVGAIVDAGPDIIQAGKDLLLGLGTGIGRAIGGVVAKAKEAAGKIVSSVKGFFGIKSPSKVFMGIGAYLDEGLADGISDNMKPVSRAMNDLGELTEQSFESEIGFNAASPSALRGLTSSIEASVSGPAGEDQLLNSLNRTMNLLQEYIETGSQIVLDDGTLVGKMAPKMDIAFGTLAVQRGRGA